MLATTSPISLGGRPRPQMQALLPLDRRPRGLPSPSRQHNITCYILPFGREILYDPEPQHTRGHKGDGNWEDSLKRSGSLGQHQEDEPEQGKPLPAVPTVPEPKLKLISKFRGAPTSQADQWKQFIGKCRLAWDVFFPAVPEVMSPAKAMKSRLQVILVSDRCGLDLPTLMKIKQDSMEQMAKMNGWDSVTELELQVERVKGNGEMMTMNLPLKNIPDSHTLRDPNHYNYEERD